MFMADDQNIIAKFFQAQEMEQGIHNDEDYKSIDVSEVDTPTLKPSGESKSNMTHLTHRTHIKAFTLNSAFEQIGGFGRF